MANTPPDHRLQRHRTQLNEPKAERVTPRLRILLNEPRTGELDEQTPHRARRQDRLLGDLAQGQLRPADRKSRQDHRNPINHAIPLSGMHFIKWHAS